MRQFTITDRDVAGDFNGDGVIDVAAAGGTTEGSPDGSGSVGVFLGPVEGALAKPSATLVGATGYDHLGITLAVGDVTGDGHTDAVSFAYPCGLYVLAGRGD